MCDDKKASLEDNCPPTISFAGALESVSVGAPPFACEGARTGDYPFQAPTEGVLSFRIEQDGARRQFAIAAPGPTPPFASGDEVSLAYAVRSCIQQYSAYEAELTVRSKTGELLLWVGELTSPNVPPEIQWKLGASTCRKEDGCVFRDLASIDVTIGGSTASSLPGAGTAVGGYVVSHNNVGPEVAVPDCADGYPRPPIVVVARSMQ